MSQQKLDSIEFVSLAAKARAGWKSQSTLAWKSMSGVFSEFPYSPYQNVTGFANCGLDQ